MSKNEQNYYRRVCVHEIKISTAEIFNPSISSLVRFPKKVSCLSSGILCALKLSVFPVNLWRLGLTGLLVLFLCMWSLFLSVCLIVSIWTCNLKLKWFLYPAQLEFIHFHKKYQSHENWKQKNHFKYVLNGFKFKKFYCKKQLKTMIFECLCLKCKLFW